MTATLALAGGPPRRQAYFERAADLELIGCTDFGRIYVVCLLEDRRAEGGRWGERATLIAICGG